MPRTSSKFESKKFRPHIFTPLYSITNLQSERLPRVFLDLFDAPNLAVVSVCP
jgi:hypothetical protein